jgi:hypothetical protein
MYNRKGHKDYRKVREGLQIIHYVKCQPNYFVERSFSVITNLIYLHAS